MVDMDDYEKTRATLKLMGELARGEKSGKEHGWTDIDDVERMFGIKNG